MKKVLITGISGGQGRLVAKRLLRGCSVAGVDSIEWGGAPKEIAFYQLDLRSKRFDNVFRTERPDAVVHLGFVRHFRSSAEYRYRVNIEGTKRLLENCAEHAVRQLVVVSSHYVYGAFPDNPRYMDENHPLGGSRSFPEIRDLVEVEGLISSFLWQHPEISTAVLRPVNILDHKVRNAIGSYLKLPLVPTIAGFDPMMQFIHGEDVADAIALAMEKSIRGVFNLCGPGAVPVSVAIRETGATRIVVPDPLAHMIIRQLFRLSIYQFPSGAIDFIKYPCTVSGRRFSEATGFEPAHSLKDTFTSARR